MKWNVLLASSAIALLPVAHADTLVYQQNFESPVGFNNDGGDINIYRTVNQLYGNQPAGFTFAQPFTTETLRVGGTEAFGQGFKDPQNIAGHYVVSMLSDAQDDRLALSFSAGAYKFLNFALDVSSIDLDRFGGPFVAAGATPVFRISLFDNPTGATTLAGNGTLLSSADITGTPSPNKYTFDWTHSVVGLSTDGSTNGNVTLQIDLLNGGYAAMDNFTVVASDIAGVVPEPATGALLLAGLGAVAGVRRRKKGAAQA